MKIRPIRAEDDEAVRRLMAQVHALHAQNRPDVYRPAEALPCADFQRMLADERLFMLAAEENGAVLGFCAVRVRRPAEDPALQRRVVAYMEDLCVDESRRHAGVGRRLYEAAEAQSRARGAHSLELMVWSFNEDALRFYRAMGMTPRSLVMERRL